MLVIPFVALLGFILYYYRPKKLELEATFGKSLLWAKVGAVCFIGQTIFTLATSYYLLSFLYNNPQELVTYMMLNPLYPLSNSGPGATVSLLIEVIFIYLFPTVAAGLVHTKLMKPLSEKKAPSQNWFHSVALFSTTILGGPLCFALWYINIPASGLEIVLHSLLLVLLFFSVLLVGVFAVEMSAYRLKARLSRR
jgi:hypothetical protein